MSPGTGFVRALVPRSARNWLRDPRLTFRRAADEVRYLMGVTTDRDLLPGWHVRCHPAAWREAYAPQVGDAAQLRELQAFARAASPGMVLFDLGAHYGAFSLAALHFGGPGARAVAVDPSPAAVRMIHRQARLNDVAGRLTVLRAAAAEHDGEIELVAAGIIAAGYYVPPDERHPASERTRVPGLTVDALVERTGMHPSHLKIDVEGAEAGVLRGARRTLRASRAPIVFLELHAAMIRAGGGDAAEPLDLLDDAGYELVDWDGVPRRPADLVRHDLVRLFARHRGWQPTIAPAGEHPHYPGA